MSDTESMTFSYYKPNDGGEMNKLPEALRELMKVEFLNQQQDGMRLGIKYAAKTLRGTADALERDPVNADYIRGLRDSAGFIEAFAAQIPPNEAAK